jgi:hypothetical protein
MFFLFVLLIKKMKVFRANHKNLNRVNFYNNKQTLFIFFIRKLPMENKYKTNKIK